MTTKRAATQATASPNGQRHAIIYDRGSTKNQKDNWSRDDAARIGGELAERNGYTWELRQEIKSGEELANRSVMLDILKGIEAGKVHAIICQDFTRLSRDEDGIDGRMIRRVCRDNDCRIITPQKAYDFAQDGDHDMSDFELLVGKMQKRANLRAMMRGMKERARQGYLVGWHAKLGYRRIPTGEIVKGRAIYWPEVIADEAELVRAVFDAVLQTGTPNAAARWLNRNGYRKPIKYEGFRKKSTGPDRVWYRNDVYRTVTDPIYAGWLVYGHQCESRYMADFEEQRRYHPELRIIDQATFDRVQDVVRTTRKARVPPSGRPYALTGLVRCDICGRAFVGFPNRQKQNGHLYVYRYYGCNGRGAASCPKSMAVSEMPLVRSLIPLTVHELEKIGDCLRPALDQAAREMSTGGMRDRLIAETQAELAEIERQIDNLARGVASGALQPDQARRVSQELTDKKQRLAGKVHDLQERVEIEAEFSRAIERLSGDIGAELWRMFEYAPGQLAQLLRFIFEPGSIVIRKHGRSYTRRIEIVSYQHTDIFSELLTSVTSQPAKLLDSYQGIAVVAALFAGVGCNNIEGAAARIGADVPV